MKGFTIYGHSSEYPDDAEDGDDDSCDAVDWNMFGGVVLKLLVGELLFIYTLSKSGTWSETPKTGFLMTQLIFQ